LPILAAIAASTATAATTTSTAAGTAQQPQLALPAAGGAPYSWVEEEEEGVLEEATAAAVEAQATDDGAPVPHRPTTQGATRRRRLVEQPRIVCERPFVKPLNEQTTTPSPPRSLVWDGNRSG